MATPQPKRIFYFGAGSSEGDPERKEILGGKGASLAALTRLGLPVPPGFTIGTECCRDFLKSGGEWPDGLEEEVRSQLARLEQETGRGFGRGPSPLLVSVRSGAAVSMPGMMDTFLNCGIHPALVEASGGSPDLWDALARFVICYAGAVHGIPRSMFPEAAERSGGPASRTWAKQCLQTCEERRGQAFPRDPWVLLAECIRAVFRSWDSDRARAYRHKHDVPDLPGTAVTVQAMFPSQISGVLFTQDPTNPKAERMILESSGGLGEAVVSGDVTPDRYLVDRSGYRVLETVPGGGAMADAPEATSARRDLAERPRLSPPQIAELCTLGLRVESHFGLPMDIEWGWAEGRFALLQSRPIRGLGTAMDAQRALAEDLGRLRRLAQGRRKVWIAHNLGETLRAPTPLTWDIVRHFMSGSGGFGRMYRDLGYHPSPEVCEQGFLELIGGRIYADPDRQAQIFWGRMPITYDVSSLIDDPARLNRVPDHFDPGRADGWLLLRLPVMAVRLIHGAWRTRRAEAHAETRFKEHAVPPYVRYVHEAQAQDLSRLTLQRLIDELHRRRARVLDDFGAESLKPGFFGGVAFGQLESLLGQALGPVEGQSMARNLVAGLEGDLAMEQHRLLAQVARQEARPEEFLDRFGHRAAHEMELSVPRWREDPQNLMRLIDRIRSGLGADTETVRQESLHRRQKAEEELPTALERSGCRSLQEDIDDALRRARRLLPYRETGKHYLMMGYALIRDVLVELSRRWGLGEDLFLLHLDELERFESEAPSLRPIIQQRKTRWQATQRFDLRDVIDSEHLDRASLREDTPAGGDLKGTPISSGVATGVAQVVLHPQGARDPGVDCVLVCPSTDPGWAPLLMQARALIVERGGMLSHGALIARELGIPAIVCPGATRRIPDGQTVRVDGNRGVISLM